MVGARTRKEKRKSSWLLRARRTWSLNYDEMHELDSGIKVACVESQRRHDEDKIRLNTSRISSNACEKLAHLRVQRIGQVAETEPVAHGPCCETGQ